MIELNHAQVKTKNFYKPGEDIDDIFTNYSEQNTNSATATFETGTEQRSIRHNAGYIVLGIIGIGLLLSPLVMKFKQ
jgi:hypothetical protein